MEPPPTGSFPSRRRGPLRCEYEYAEYEYAEHGYAEHGYAEHGYHPHHQGRHSYLAGVLLLVLLPGSYFHLSLTVVSSFSFLKLIGLVLLMLLQLTPPVLQLSPLPPLPSW